MTEYEQISRKLDRVIELLEQKPKPHLTRKEFGQLIGKSARTISRWVEARKIVTEKGMIPAKELKKFTS